MTKAKQITAWMENTPGTLGRIAKALGEARVSLTAFMASTVGAKSAIRLQVNDPAGAKKILQELGIRASEEEVLRLTLEDTPGALADIATRLAEARINVEYAYATVPTGSKKADVVLSVSDVAGAYSVLKRVVRAK